MMSLHKLTAGDGYTYLTRQVAAQDATHRGYDGLGDYYAQKGESPGIWTGAGLAGLSSLLDPALAAAVSGASLNRPVSEAQMRALFGEGIHPDAEQVRAALRAAGHGEPAVLAATRLGQPFHVYSAVNEFRRRAVAGFEAWNAERGLPRDWPVPADERARIRTVVARDMFTAEYDRPPADARELSGFLARASRQATTAVAGYDLTFSPVKSVSTLWALAPIGVARVIEQAHHDAVADTLAWLEQRATYTRTGHRSAQQIDVRGLIAAAFTHRDSRAGDPDLHTHVAISNKVQALDGRWLALDGRPLYKFTVSASERYNTRLEALLVARLGVAFAERSGVEAGKRPVREIVGIDAALLARWSARRQMIDVRRGELAIDFQQRHGRPPTTVEALALAQQATLETRQGKHEPRSWGEQRTAWRAEAVTVLGGPQRLAAMLTESIPRRRPAATDTPVVTADWVATIADEVLAAVQADRASWQEAHVRAEAERVARDRGVALAEVDGAVEALVGATLGPGRSIALGTPEPVDEPVELRRRDGTSVYATVGTQLYTSSEILAAEQRLVAAARRRDGRQVDEAAVDVALLESLANGVELNPGQAELVRELARSGARVQLALAPAGTGKTTAMRVLARAWASDDGAGAGNVIGLAPSAAAASVLRAELVGNGARPAAHRLGRLRGGQVAPHTDTLAKLLDATGGFYRRTGWLPDWVRGIGPRTLVVIDEAGMAGTLELARVVDFLLARGASVRLVGDDQQLAAVGAGGVLRDIAHTVGVVALSQVVRFTNPTWGRAEAAASLALRDGDGAAIGFYLDQDRVHVGDLATATEHTYQAWRRDRNSGRDSIMLAPTREIVTALNRRARADRLATLAGGSSTRPAGVRVDHLFSNDAGPTLRAGRPGTFTGRDVPLGDGTRASSDDLIIARRNRRTMPITKTEWVKNGDRFRIHSVRRNGSLKVTHLATGRTITLPAAYVSRHVTLGYASTVHTAQGITADTAHLVATGEETRQLFYVGMTRGRDQNHVYLVTAGDGDPHSVITREALLPPTPVGVLTRILERDGAPVSATSAQRDATDPAARLGDAATRYLDALLVAAERHLGPDRMRGLDVAAEQTLAGLTAQPAYPTLRSTLALLTLSGCDPVEHLRTALAQREIDTAVDTAAVLTWRLDPTTPVPETSAAAATRNATGPLPWLPGVPAALAGDLHWGAYLRPLADWVHDLADQVRAQTRGWTPTTAPAWATGLLATDVPLAGSLIADLAVWRAATRTDPAELAPGGPPRYLVAEVRHQRRLEQRVDRVLGDPRTTASRWQPLARRLEPRLLQDPYWPQLAARLDAAHRAGLDISAVATRAAGAGPLPDEQPATAVWWRIVQHLAPGVLPADLTTGSSLRPVWTPVLAELLGEAAARRVQADPAWPALVAAVTTATADGWQPNQLLEAAHSLSKPSAGPDETTLRPDELATALVWRIGTLTDPPPDTDLSAVHPDARFDPAPTPEEVAELAELLPPADLDRLPTTVEDPHRIDVSPEPTQSPADRSHRRDRGELSVIDKLDAVWAFDRHGQPAGDWADAYLEEHHWATAPIPRARLVELNEQAMDYYTARYRHSWAPGYLRQRLGTDLAEHPVYRVGFAPPGWTHLTEHLRRLGATDSELLAAGLASRSSRSGQLLDVFRDRLVFPIRDADTADIIAFIARRNPAIPDTATDVDGSRPGPDPGPKYLNTRTTDLFVKGEHVYGLAEAADQLAAGATVVRVEGPLDAIAVSLAGHGELIGAAQLGTSFTATQAALLTSRASAPSAGPVRAVPPVIVATDADTAGRKAAAADFWRLAAAGDTPRHALLPDGLDPAELLQTHGPETLRTALSSAGRLADTLIAQRLEFYAERLDTVEGRHHATRAVVQVLAALPPDQWIDGLAPLADQLARSSAGLQLEILDAAYSWIQGPATLADRFIAEQQRAWTTARRGASAGRQQPGPADSTPSPDPIPAARATHPPMAAHPTRRPVPRPDVTARPPQAPRR